MMKKRILKNLFHSFGLEISRYREACPSYLKTLLDRYEVDLILDVGANSGQSAKFFRTIGYDKQIISIEPVRELFEQLNELANCDDRMTALHSALGDFTGTTNINVSGSSAVASSILDMTKNVVIHAPDQIPVRTEKIDVTTLDEVLYKYYPNGHSCFLKLDVQGYEKKVLEGGISTLGKVIGLKVEMSLVENYSGETLLHEMIPELYSKGFR